MGVKKGGRKEGRGRRREGNQKDGGKGKGKRFRERGNDRGRLNLADGFMTRLFKGCLVAFNL